MTNPISRGVTETQKKIHAMANGRSRTNHISVIEDEGRRIEREMDKSEYFYNKFKERFSPDISNPSAMGD